jgi:hypothetical protein
MTLRACLDVRPGAPRMQRAGACVNLVEMLRLIADVAIGGPTRDSRDGGRILLPLECYTPGAPGGSSTGAAGTARMTLRLPRSGRAGVIAECADLRAAVVTLRAAAR